MAGRGHATHTACVGKNANCSPAVGPRGPLAGGHHAGRVSAHRADRRGRFWCGLQSLRHLAGTRCGTEGVHAFVAGAAYRRRHAGAGEERALPRDLRGRPRELRERSQDAGQLRPPVAGEGLPLLGGQWHRLHGDAAAEGHDAEGCAARHEAWRPDHRRSLAAQRAGAADRSAAGHPRRAGLPPRHRARQRDVSAREKPLVIAGLRRGAACHQRTDAGAHRHLEAGLRAGGAVRRDPGHEAGRLDRRLCAGRRGLFRHHRQDATAQCGPHLERHLPAAGGKCRRPLQRSLPGRHRPRAGRAARTPHAEHRRTAPRPGFG